VTASALLKSTKASGGPNAGIRYVVNLIRQHGAPVSGKSLDILISGWAVCGALAKSAVTLGTLSSSENLHGEGTPGHIDKVHKRKGHVLQKAAGFLGALGSSSIRLRRLRNRSSPVEAAAEDSGVDIHAASGKLRIATRVAHFGTRLMRRVAVSGISKRKYYHHKVGVTHAGDEGEEHSNLWQMLPAGEVLHCLRLGAKALDGQDFKELLQAAWSLFNECDVVTWMIEPKSHSDSRASQLLAAQEALAEVVTVDSHPGQHAGDAEPIHQQLVRSHTAMQQLKELCEGDDDGLLRRAALYGLPILLERVCVWVHASADQITNPLIARPSRVAVHEMDSIVAKVQESFTPYEVAAEDGLGYQAPNHSNDASLSARGNPAGGAAVVCEEAWSRFLRSRENAQRSQRDAKTEESTEHALSSSSRFCTHKLLRPGF